MMGGGLVRDFTAVSSCLGVGMFPLAFLSSFLLFTYVNMMITVTRGDSEVRRWSTRRPTLHVLVTARLTAVIATCVLINHGT